MPAEPLSNPLISVVTPTFNQGKYIRETIESVRRQTYRNFEYIVMDGGSTDETVSILKEYPEIRWVSEPDRGQADALNKALTLAKGDIIAWINSDDWYEPNALELAVRALQHEEIAMGRCEVFEDGKAPLYTVPNFGRNFFDLLKYWIAYSIPTQPSIFFRRSLLDRVVRNQTEFVDPDLHYCMDYDLWIRIAATHPLTTRIDAVTSHYRFTDTNKTSPNRPILSYAGAEMAAVFHRAEGMTGASRQVSYVIEASEPSDALNKTVRSLLADSKTDFEIIIATQKVSKAMRGFIEEVNAGQEANRNYRFVFPIVSSRRSSIARVSDAIDRCAGRIIVSLPAGSEVPVDISDQLIKAFQDDRLGLVLPFSANKSVITELNQDEIEDSEHIDFAFNTFLFSCFPQVAFAIRRVTWLEGPSFRDESHSQREFKRLIFTRIRQGWHARLNLPIPVSFPEKTKEAGMDLFGKISGAELVAESTESIASDPFWGVRNGYRLCLQFSDDAVSRSKELLSKAPKGWELGLAL